MVAFMMLVGDGCRFGFRLACISAAPVFPGSPGAGR
jgi:hypothetical protein